MSTDELEEDEGTLSDIERIELINRYLANIGTSTSSQDSEEMGRINAVQEALKKNPKMAAKVDEDLAGKPLSAETRLMIVKRILDEINKGRGK